MSSIETDNFVRWGCKVVAILIASGAAWVMWNIDWHVIAGMALLIWANNLFYAADKP